MKRAAGLAACLLFAAPAPVRTEDASGSVPSERDFLREGLAEERRGDMAAAVLCFSQGLVTRPDDPALDGGLRRVAARLHAVRERERSRKEDGYVRSARRSRREARARERDEEDRCRAAARLLGRGDGLGAFDAYRRLIDERGGSRPALRGLARTEKLLESMRRAGRFPSPRHGAAVDGFLLYARKDWAAAADALERASAEPVPEELAAAHVPEYAAAARREASRASKLAERDAAFEKAMEDYRAGRVAEAERGLEGILARDPADEPASAALAALRTVASGIRDSVRREAERGELAERMTGGTLDFIQKRYTEALEKFSRVLELDPENAEAKELIADVRAAMRGEGLFVPSVPVAGGADSAYREGLRRYGDEDYAGAVASFREALASDPAHGGARDALDRLRAQMPALFHGE